MLLTEMQREYTYLHRNQEQHYEYYETAIALLKLNHWNVTWIARNISFFLLL